MLASHRPLNHHLCVKNGVPGSHHAARQRYARPQASSAGRQAPRNRPIPRSAHWNTHAGRERLEVRIPLASACCRDPSQGRLQRCQS